MPVTLLLDHSLVGLLTLIPLLKSVESFAQDLQYNPWVESQCEEVNNTAVQKLVSLV